MKEFRQKGNYSGPLLYSENDETGSSGANNGNCNVTDELLSLIYGVLRILLFFVSIFSGAIITLLFRISFMLA